MWVMRLLVIEIGSFRCWAGSNESFQLHFVWVNNHRVWNFVVKSALFGVKTADVLESAPTSQIPKSSYTLLFWMRTNKEIYRIVCNLKVLYCFFFCCVRVESLQCLQHSLIFSPKNLLYIIKISYQWAHLKTLELGILCTSYSML